MDELLKFTFWLAAAVLLPLLLRLTYGLFLQDKEVQLKGFLVQKRSERSHRRKVGEFVGAFNGRASIENARVTGYAMLAWGLVLFFFLFGAASYVRVTMESAKLTITRAEKALAASDAQMPVANSEDWDADLSYLKAKVSDVERFGLPIIWVAVAIVGACTVYGFWSWLPSQIRLRYFEFEVQRFVRHMHTLADEEERAILALAEIGVQDEESLKEFIRVANKIAARHSASILVRRFDLWNVTDFPA